MSGESALGLADAIEDLRDELELARSRVKADGITFPIRSVTVELQMVAVKEGEGKAGFKIPVIDLELGVAGRVSREATHRIVIEFATPVTASGEAIRVNRVSSVPRD